MLMFGGDIVGIVGSVFGGSSNVDDGVAEASSTPEALFTPVALPAGLDDLVTATGVRVPLVVPRTLEVTGAFTTTTFPILPVSVDVADWPCPQQDQPVVCWIHGTVVNVSGGKSRA